MSLALSGKTFPTGVTAFPDSFQVASSEYFFKTFLPTVQGLNSGLMIQIKTNKTKYVMLLNLWLDLTNPTLPRKNQDLDF